VVLEVFDDDPLVGDHQALVEELRNQLGLEPSRLLRPDSLQRLTLEGES
jgi:hypothetical protein